MSEFQGNTWPEQEAVFAWMKKHNITDITAREAIALIDAVTKPRLALQARVEKLEAYIAGTYCHNANGFEGPETYPDCGKCLRCKIVEAREVLAL